MPGKPPKESLPDGILIRRPSHLVKLFLSKGKAALSWAVDVPDPWTICKAGSHHQSQVKCLRIPPDLISKVDVWKADWLLNQKPCLLLSILSVTVFGASLVYLSKGLSEGSNSLTTQRKQSTVFKQWTMASDLTLTFILLYCKHIE